MSLKCSLKKTQEEDLLNIIPNSIRGNKVPVGLMKGLLVAEKIHNDRFHLTSITISGEIVWLWHLYKTGKLL